MVLKIQGEKRRGEKKKPSSFFTNTNQCFVVICLDFFLKESFI
jgi:hypothetical protein